MPKRKDAKNMEIDKIRSRSYYAQWLVTAFKVLFICFIFVIIC